MFRQKYDLSRILYIEKFVVYSPAQKEKDHKDTQNFFTILKDCLVWKGRFDETIEQLVKLFNKKFKVDSYNEAYIISSKLSNDKSKILQRLTDEINKKNEDIANKRAILEQ